MKRGRKPKPPEELARHKFRNISVDADILERIKEAADALEGQFGFRPTISQALRHLIMKAPR